MHEKIIYNCHHSMPINSLSKSITDLRRLHHYKMSLLLNDEVFRIPGLALIQVCTTFATQPLPARYSVSSNVSTELFQKFLSALKGETIEVTKVNFPDLSTLCQEFGFKMENQSYRFAQLEVKIEELTIEIGRLLSEVAALRRTPAITAQLSEEVTELRADISVLKTWINRLFNSRIIANFPEIFAEFRGKQFSLLWRGGCDGFAASEFHRRCDGHANTLTVILDTKGNIFGGFTPLEWESRVWNGKEGKESNLRKADDSLKSFLFTLKNPHNILAKRFALKAAENDRAILCSSTHGPHFWDIRVSNNCNANTISWAFWDGSDDVYINDTGLDGNTFFTGSKYFQVKEIEVFEITD
jgi:hypothetical protein